MNNETILESYSSQNNIIRFRAFSRLLVKIIYYT
ncbi:hypothetical protein REIS_0047 [Rickettsia endosymbiont of Ixodes scapularis]|nr:hypothetical protein REIS_0047 [Rickettsia endosymbiont of Ixodes scapularis]